MRLDTGISRIDVSNGPALPFSPVSVPTSPTSFLLRMPDALIVQLAPLMAGQWGRQQVARDALSQWLDGTRLDAQEAALGRWLAAQEHKLRSLAAAPDFSGMGVDWNVAHTRSFVERTVLDRRASHQRQALGQALQRVGVDDVVPTPQALSEAASGPRPKAPKRTPSLRQVRVQHMQARASWSLAMPYAAVGRVVTCPRSQTIFSHPVHLASSGETVDASAVTDPDELAVAVPDRVISTLADIWRHRHSLGETLSRQRMARALSCPLSDEPLTWGWLASDGHTYAVGSLRRQLARDVMSPLVPNLRLSLAQGGPHHRVIWLAQVFGSATTVEHIAEPPEGRFAHVKVVLANLLASLQNLPSFGRLPPSAETRHQRRVLEQLDSGPDWQLDDQRDFGRLETLEALLFQCLRRIDSQQRQGRVEPAAVALLADLSIWRFLFSSNTHDLQRTVESLLPVLHHMPSYDQRLRRTCFKAFFELPLSDNERLLPIQLAQQPVHERKTVSMPLWMRFGDGALGRALRADVSLPWLFQPSEQTGSVVLRRLQHHVAASGLRRRVGC